LEKGCEAEIMKGRGKKQGEIKEERKGIVHGR
jgi:hypothetical protein